MPEERLEKGAQVEFRLADAVCPDLDQIVAQVSSYLTVTGELVLLSKGEDKTEEYAVVNVAGINAPLIVPAGSLQPFLCGKGTVTRPGCSDRAVVRVVSRCGRCGG